MSKVDVYWAFFGESASSTVLKSVAIDVIHPTPAPHPSPCETHSLISPTNTQMPQGLVSVVPRITTYCSTGFLPLTLGIEHSSRR